MIVLTLGVLGLLFCALWIRGRRVGDTPYCRHCGYDLRGMVSTTCAECGTDAMKRVVRGTLERDNRLLGAGLVLLMAALCWHLTPHAIGTIVHEYPETMPTWLLCHTLTSNSAGSHELQHDSLQELRRRISSTEVSEAEVKSILAVVDCQWRRGCRQQPLARSVLDLLVHLFVEGCISREEMEERALSFLPTASLLIEPHPVHVGQPVRIHCVTRLCVPKSLSYWPVRQTIRIDGTAVYEYPVHGQDSEQFGLHTFDRPGPHLIEFEWFVEVYMNSPDSVDPARAALVLGDQPLTTVKRCISATVRILPIPERGAD